MSPEVLLIYKLSSSWQPVFRLKLVAAVQVEGFGIKSIATIFQEFGYQQRDELQFPAKKLRALWFSPPQDRPDLPRIFISEIKVEQHLETSCSSEMHTCISTPLTVVSYPHCIPLVDLVHSNQCANMQRSP